MDNIILTRILFFAMFLWVVVYAFVSFSNNHSFIYQFERALRYLYGLGLMIMAVSSYNIFVNITGFYYSLNMFLLGGILTIFSTALQMSKK